MAVKIALAGNPNCGKTTLFNALTGSNQFVGNWPGVTVEKKEGKLKGHKDITIMDLPGIYSLSPYTLEEVVARNYLINEKPDVIINIVDGTNIERNLYLSTQLLELGIPVVMAVNMADLLEKSGKKINISKLSTQLGCEVTVISALKGTGIMEAVEKAAALAGKKKTPVIHKFSDDVEEIIQQAEDKLNSTIPEEKKRFFAIKLLERDDKISQQAENLPDVSVEIAEMEEKFDDDTESIITNERYTYISSIIGECCTKGRKEKLSVSDKIDQIVTNRVLALPIFAAVMFIVYYVSVTTVGTWATDWANDGVFGEGWNLLGISALHVPGIPDAVGNLLDSIGCAEWLSGLVIDGIIGGVGAVLGFVPQMLILFMFLAFLESCGYMARVAFIMDRIFRKFGLSGKSFIPMLIGSGCGVPGIMASRTIENDRDRKMTIMTTTFIPCGAKLPIIALVAGALFNNAWWVSYSAWLVGILAIICSGIILKKTKLFAGDPAPFVMELPNYRMPGAKNVGQLLWEKAKDFLQRAFTVIFVATIVIWFLQTFDIRLNVVKDAHNSLLALLAGTIAPVFKPLGFGDWRISTALLTGFMAKESIVSILSVLIGSSSVLLNTITTAGAASLLVFCLLYTPCVAAVASVKRELGGRWAFIVVIGQCVIAWLAAFVIYRVLML